MAQTTRRGGTAPYEPKNDFAGTGLFDRLNHFLFRYIGPPPLGPYDEDPAPASGDTACPSCGAPMATHEIDRASGVARLYCPEATSANRTSA